MLVRTVGDAQLRTGLSLSLAHTRVARGMDAPTGVIRGFLAPNDEYEVYHSYDISFLSFGMRRKNKHRTMTSLCVGLMSSKMRCSLSFARF